MLNQLNPQQRKAVLHDKGPALVLAGAGSGKTKVVTCRIAHLIDQGVAPESILAVTFTNKAAKEMQERIEALGKSPVVCTFHSLGVKMLRESIDALGYEKSFVIYDQEDTLKLLKSVLAELNLDSSQSVCKQLKATISEAKNQMKGPDLVSADMAYIYKSDFAQIYKLYQEKLLESNACDFDDLLYLPVILMEQNASIREYFQTKWHYLLIDEYQDTNHAQYRFAKILSQQHNNIFVVGDPDQSIYSWRGAHLGNILNFEQDFPGAVVIALEQNYRSCKNILDVSNALIRHNPSRYEKKLWSDKGSGEKITLLIADNEAEEAEFVASQIYNLYHHHNVPLKQCAVLYRTNFQSRSFEDAFLRKKLPYQIVGGLSFYQRKEIKDVLAYLHLILNPTNTLAFMRAISTPKRGLGEASLKLIQKKASEIKLPILQFCEHHLEVLGLTKKKIKTLHDFCSMIQQLRKMLATEPLHRVVVETIRASNYLDELTKDQESFEDRKGNLDELVAKTAEWESFNPEGTLEDFLSELSLNTSETQNVDDDKVFLMTLHHGKGLEFMTAFLVGMEEDLFPHVNAKDSPIAIEEERRLCYVGMTRAKEKLILTASKVRFIWGSYRKMRPSRFLKEIPREYLEKVWSSSILNNH